MIVRVGSHQVSVAYWPEGHPDAEDNLGMFYASPFIIRIAAGRPPHETAQTLMHEVLHAMWTAGGMPDDVDEEITCAGLEAPLVSFIHDNPVLLQMIAGGFDGIPLLLPTEEV